jgi:hypothetical protein
MDRLSFIEQEENPIQWLENRAWATSGNRIVADNDEIMSSSKSLQLQDSTQSKTIYYPTTTEQVSDIIKSSPLLTPIAAVCGGNEASNAPLVANQGAIILDFKKMNGIYVNSDEKTVTVQAGVVFRDLATVVRDAKCALPFGTGPGVGAIGFTINGGLSGYFSRRLGLLAQRVTHLTMVDAKGEIHSLSKEQDDEDVFTAMLGAGSALGIVTDMTFQMEDESILKEADQYVFVTEDPTSTVQFSRWILEYIRAKILPVADVSAEVITTANLASIVTLVFYDKFEGESSDYWKPILDQASNLALGIVAEHHWSSWFDVTASAWPLIDQLKGSPLVMLHHCCGTVDQPSDKTLDFFADTWIGDGLLKLGAEHSIVEARTLGGSAMTSRSVPSGNCQHNFFINIIVMYDAANKTNKERQEIKDSTSRLVSKARKLDSLVVNFSGTHSQADDKDHPVNAKEIFGGEQMADVVAGVKATTDPCNRFRFHPFAQCLGDNLAD